MTWHSNYQRGQTHFGYFIFPVAGNMQLLSAKLILIFIRTVITYAFYFHRVALININNVRMTGRQFFR